jgi:hypothetical protein
MVTLNKQANKTFVRDVRIRSYAMFFQLMVETQEKLSGKLLDTTPNQLCVSRKTNAQSRIRADVFHAT